MQWKDVAQQLARLGLPILGTALAGPAGAAVGQMLANAVIAPQQDTTATPQEVAKWIIGDPALLQKAREFEAQYSKQILEIHLGALQKSDEGQVELNKIDGASDSFFRSGWRPATGWVCVFGLAYQLLVRPLGGWVMQQLLGWTPPPSLEVDTLMTLLFGLLGLGAYRTVERIKGKA